jgi:hypothetical protein
MCFGDVIIFSLFSKRESVAQLIAGFDFTFLGFLLTMATVAFSLPSSYRIKKYKADGYFKIYTHILALTALYLIVDLLLSVLLLSNTRFSPIILKLLMVFFINSLCLAIVSFKIIYNLLTHVD